MVGQKLDLKENKQRDRSKDQADVRYATQHETSDAASYLARPGKDLYENITRQLPTELCAHFLIGNLSLQFSMEDADLASKQNEMEKHVAVDSEKQRRPQEEKANKRNIDIEERQFDWICQEEIVMRYAADSNEKI
jgi:hypothetical protein